jgi:hypothetical protein
MMEQFEAAFETAYEAAYSVTLEDQDNLIILYDDGEWQIRIDNRQELLARLENMVHPVRLGYIEGDAIYLIVDEDGNYALVMDDPSDSTIFPNDILNRISVALNV